MVRLDKSNFNIEHIANSGQCFRWRKIAPDRYAFIEKWLIYRNVD